MAPERGDGVDAGGSDVRVGVSQAARDAGEELGEVRGERVTVSLAENGDDPYALLPHRGLVGRVGGVDAGDEDAKGARLEVASYGVELGGGDAIGVSIGELVQARVHALLQVLRRRSRVGGGCGEWHFGLLGFYGSVFKCRVGDPATLPEDVSFSLVVVGSGDPTVGEETALDLTLLFKQEVEWGPIMPNCPRGRIRRRFGVF